jgi:transcriptional regulator with XRE-family HTH domain
MITTPQLRRMVKLYLKHPRSVTQNELARRSGMGNSTLSQFLDAKHNGVTSEQVARMLDVIAPWERDPICIAGKFKTQLLKQYFSMDEIAIMAMHLTPETKR